ncbi:MAG: ABC-type transport auxiliary lipoprotein family protein [Candidatus Acidiferrales bacterium]
MLKHHVRLAAAAAALAWICAGCGAVRPTKYYTLDVAATPAAPSTSPNAVSILVSHVTSSHLYRDDRIVYGSGQVQLGVYDDHRWAETPVNMIQDALISSLRATGQYRSVSRVGSSARGEYILRSQLISLYEADRPNLLARFSMHIELFDPKAGATIWTDSYSHDEPVSSKTVAAVVEAMDKNVHAGMQQFTTGLAQYFASHPPQTEAAH